jgi:heat shock protein beta
MRAQTVALGSDLGMDRRNQTVMEINPNHPIVKDPERMVKGNMDSKETEEYALLMYDMASMTSGYDFSDMGSFAKRVMNMMDERTKMDGTVNDAKIEEPSSDQAVAAEVVTDDE